MDPLFELTVTPAPRGSREVASSLYDQLRSAIISGRLRAGSRLPPTRASQAAFGVSRNTAQDVYDRLIHEGLADSKHGSGTFVCESRARPKPPEENAQTPFLGINPFWEREDVRSWIGFWHEEHQMPAVEVQVDLRPGLVDQTLFPHAAFRRTMARHLRALENSPASSRSPQRNQGSGYLRGAIADYIGLTRAIACSPDDIVVTSGSQQAFDLLARTLVIPGKTVVAVEDPGYPPMRIPFAAAGARVVPVRVDKDGLIVDEIPADARVVCVCPSHHFPLGMTLSAQRRRELVQFAERRGALILEDDYDGEFRYGTSPLEALRGTASSDVVCYVGSFSKTMFPAIRLGFMVPPRSILQALVAAKNATDWHCSVPTQTAVAGFIMDGHLARHIKRARQVYRSRRDFLVARLEQRIPDALTALPSHYGMHIAAIARQETDCKAVAAALVRRGVMIHSLDRYFLGPARWRGFILGYAAADRQQMDWAIEAMARELGGLADRSNR